MSATTETDLHAWAPDDDWDGLDLETPHPCHYCQRDQAAHAADFDAWRGSAAFALGEHLLNEDSNAAGYSDDEMVYDSLRRGIELLTIAGVDPRIAVSEGTPNKDAPEND